MESSRSVIGKIVKILTQDCQSRRNTYYVYVEVLVCVRRQKGSRFFAPWRSWNARLIVFNSRIGCFPTFFRSVVDPKCVTHSIYGVWRRVWKICSGNSIDGLCAVFFSVGEWSRIEIKKNGAVWIWMKWKNRGVDFSYLTVLFFFVVFYVAAAATATAMLQCYGLSKNEVLDRRWTNVCVGGGDQQEWI